MTLIKIRKDSTEMPRRRQIPDVHVTSYIIDGGRNQERQYRDAKEQL